MTIILSPEGQIIGFPLPEQGHWRLVHVSTHPVEPSDAEPDRLVTRLQTLLREYGRPEAVVSDPGWTSAFKVHRRVAGRFREGRCFIAGDAAHIHSPAGGQGMNTGIQDAYNLAWKLALVDRGESPESLLDSYSVERRGVVAGVVKGSHLITRVVTLRSPIAKGLRDHLAGILGEFDFVSRKMSRNLSELGVEYHASPIVAEDRGGIFRTGVADTLDFRGSLHPGDRIPDVLLEPPQDVEGPTRLFEVLQGTKHVLLVFEGEHVGNEANMIEGVLQFAKGQERQITTYFVVRGDVAPPSIAWEGPLIRDHEGMLHQRFGARGACLYLIRPDGYLGYRSIPPDRDKLAAYLGRIFVA
jgi:hypothetical protein